VRQILNLLQPSTSAYNIGVAEPTTQESLALSFLNLSNAFEAIEPEIIRFPALDSGDLRRKIASLVEQLQQETEDGQL